MFAYNQWTLIRVNRQYNFIAHCAVCLVVETTLLIEACVKLITYFSCSASDQVQKVSIGNAVSTSTAGTAITISHLKASIKKKLTLF